MEKTKSVKPSKNSNIKILTNVKRQQETRKEKIIKLEEEKEESSLSSSSLISISLPTPEDYPSIN